MPRAPSAARPAGHPAHAEPAPVHRVHRHHVPATRGLGLRVKIMLAMGLVTMGAGILIFVAVYGRAVGALENQINARGAQLVDLLASVDPGYWKAAIHYQDATYRERLFGHFINWLPKADDFQTKPEFLRLRELLVQPFGDARRQEVESLITNLTIEPHWKERLSAEPGLRDWYEILVTGFRDLSSLRPFQNLREVAGRDLFEVAVYDLEAPGARNPPGITMKGHRELQGEYFPDWAKQSGQVRGDVPYRDEVENVSGDARMFIRNPAPEDPVKLRYVVSLSLRGIGDAKRDLLFSILLPILASLAVAMAIAAWVSHRIANPLRILINDIHVVSSGNFDHQTEATSTDEVGELADAFNRMTAALRIARDQELDSRALEHELEIASEIQINLVPRALLKLPGYDISAYYRPSKEVGGDYYDFIEIDPEHSGLIVADASGKGIPGSLVMAMARALIRMEADRNGNVSPADTLRRVNRMLARDIRKGMFVTTLYAVLDHRNHTVTVSSAGHNPMILWRQVNDAVTLVNPKGIALGLDAGPVFDRSLSEQPVPLEHGDRIVLYSDGAVEMRNPQSQEFGDARFQELIKKLARHDSNQFLHLLLKALDEHRGGAPQHDDLTVVTLRRV